MKFGGLTPCKEGNRRLGSSHLNRKSAEKTPRVSNVLMDADYGLIRYPRQSVDLAEVSAELAPRIATVGSAEYLSIHGAG